MRNIWPHWLTSSSENVHPTPCNGSRFCVQEPIGQGTSAHVYLALDRLTNQHVALKVPKSRKTPMETEMHILAHLKHQTALTRSIRLRQITLISERICLVTDVAQGKDLASFVDEYPKLLPIRLVRNIFRETVLAVKELHDFGVAHLDIKLENVFYNPKTERVTLIDFGFAEFVYANLKHHDEELRLESFNGSLQYTCPEICTQTPYQGTKADIWSLGVLLYTLLAKQFPFFATCRCTTLKNITTGSIQWHSGFTCCMKDLILSMLCVDPAERISLSEILSHPFLDC